MIRFACPSCHKRLKAPENKAGFKIACPRCAQRLEIPGPTTLPARQKTILGSLLSPFARPPAAVAAPEGPAAPPAQALVVACPGCRCQLRITAAMLGMPLKCPRCSTAFTTGKPPPVETVAIACPGCARTIALQPHELSQTIECACCARRFVPGQVPPTPPSPARRETRLDDLEVLTPGVADETEPDDLEVLPAVILRRRHSGLGMVSFLIAVLVGGLDLILAAAIATGIAGLPSGPGAPPDGAESSSAGRIVGEVARACLNCLSVPVCLVGLGLGFVGLAARRDRKHLFTWLGLVGNGVVVLAILALAVVGMVLAR